MYKNYTQRKCVFILIFKRVMRRTNNNLYNFKILTARLIILKYNKTVMWLPR